MTKRELTALVVRHIMAGKLDNQLETLVNAANARRSIVHDQKVAENMVLLNEPGTRVRIMGNVRPKYLVGHEGDVVTRPFNFRNKSGLIYVDIGQTVRGRYGPVVGVPASALEAVDA